MKVEKMFNMYGVSLDHSKDERLPLEYQEISHLFDTFKADTKAIILEDLGIDFELEDSPSYETCHCSCKACQGCLRK